MINDFDLEISRGEFITFFGPNGCGKTTLLRLVAGLESQDSGHIFINGKTPAEARTGFVFQNYADALMPWLTAIENILFAYRLRRRRASKPNAEKRLAEMLAALELELPLRNFPYQLSGGQQQLVSILRTLIYDPEVILMDEPFSSLDHQTRGDMQQKLYNLWRHEQSTILFVSHDIEEAIFLADRLVLLLPRPTAPKAILEVPFTHPRSRSLLESDDFFGFKRSVLETFRN